MGAAKSEKGDSLLIVSNQLRPLVVVLVRNKKREEISFQQAGNLGRLVR